MESLIVPLLIAGTTVATVGAVQQGRAADAQAKSEQDILDFNAAQKIKEAEAQRTAAEAEAEKFAVKAKRLKGAQAVAIARAGVLSTVGTPALLLEETAQELEADRIAILEQGGLEAGFTESEAFGMRFQGTSARARGKNIRRGSVLSAGGTLLTGLGSAGVASRKSGGNKSA